MPFDLLLRNARIIGEETPHDIGIADGRIAAIAVRLPGGGPEEDLEGNLAIPGFVETHIHLDKACLLARCPCHAGTLAQAIASVAAAKRDFTVEDVTERAERTLEKAIVQGTTHMRTHVEVDPRVGLISFQALKALKQAYRWAIDISLCVFPQEGLTDDPGCEDVLVSALHAGADAIGGAPYRDKDPAGQLSRIFHLAKAFDVDIDLHLDFDLDPSRSDMEEVCRLTDRSGWGGRVAIGHVTKLSAMPPERVEQAARRLAGAGVATTVLPATDLYLNGREHAFNIPRGVAPAHRLAANGVICSIATNNVLNPFTPYGDCSLVRMANLFANVAQLGSPDELALCFQMITTMPAKLLNLAGYGIAVGHAADLVVLDCQSPDQAISAIAQPRFGMKRGRRTFNHPRPELLR